MTRDNLKLIEWIEKELYLRRDFALKRFGIGDNPSSDYWGGKADGLESAILVLRNALNVMEK